MSLLGILVSTTMVAAGCAPRPGVRSGSDDATQPQRALLAITADVRASRVLLRGHAHPPRLLAQHDLLRASPAAGGPAERVTYERRPTASLTQTRESGTGRPTTAGLARPRRPGCARWQPGVLQPAAVRAGRCSPPCRSTTAAPVRHRSDRRHARRVRHHQPTSTRSTPSRCGSASTARPRSGPTARRARQRGPRQPPTADPRRGLPSPSSASDRGADDPPPPRPRDEEGFALLAVIGGMLSLSLVVLATLTYVVNSLPVTRRAQDAGAALQAAQAGIDDYLGRLATCDSYWMAPCDGNVNAALAGGPPSRRRPPHPGPVPLPGAAAPRTTRPGCCGCGPPGGSCGPASRDAKRTLVVDLRSAACSTTSTTPTRSRQDPTGVHASQPARDTPSTGQQRRLHPDAYAGVTAAEAAKCNRYWYATATSPARRRPPPRLHPQQATAERPRPSAPVLLLRHPVRHHRRHRRSALHARTRSCWTGRCSWHGQHPLAAGTRPRADPQRLTTRHRRHRPAVRRLRPAYDSEDVTLPPDELPIKNRTDPRWARPARLPLRRSHPHRADRATARWTSPAR